jgi:hypothetical protein
MPSDPVPRVIARWWRRWRARRPGGGADPQARELAREALRLLTQPPRPEPRASSVPAPPYAIPGPLSPEELAALRVMLRARELLRARSGHTPPPTLDADGPLTR